jgi:hypothetical protein
MTTTSRQVQVTVAIAALTLACYAPASAQKITEVEGLTLAGTLGELIGPLGSRPAADAIGLATALEISTAPFGTSTGGFLFRLDPGTGLLVRTATTFGPSFADRALTSGEGQVSVGASFSATTYKKLGDLSLDALRIGAISAASAGATRTGTADLNLSSRTLVLSSTVGITDNLDVGVAIPMVSIKMAGSSTLLNGSGVVVREAEGSGTFGGIGDVAALAKYRFVRFGTGLPDPGGIALAVNMRLPTGDREALRGLGVYRTLASLVVSSGARRFRPHANAGYEWWSDGVEVGTGFSQNDPVAVRHQIQYAAGVELEATPKLTLLVDFLGRHIQGGGQVGFVAEAPSTIGQGITSVESMVALPEGIRKLLLVPGLKMNLKGKLLLSLNAVIALKHNGLHSTVTPVVGIDLSL